VQLRLEIALVVGLDEAERFRQQRFRLVEVTGPDLRLDERCAPAAQ
jgi:hypothetical protein